MTKARLTSPQTQASRTEIGLILLSIKPSEAKLEQEQDRIEVIGEHEDEQAANAVDLYLNIEGSAFFTGRAALSKAREIAALVESLQQAGLAADNIDVLSVSTTVQSGVFSKSSSANYELRVRVNNLELYGQVLGAISASKQVTLHRHDWRYPSDDAYLAQLLAKAAAQGAVKARAIAEALGARLAGIMHAQERIVHADHEPRPQMAMFASHRVRAAGEPADLGMQVQNRRKMKGEVQLTFRVLNNAQP